MQSFCHVVHVENTILCKFKERKDIQNVSRKEGSPKMTTNNIEEDLSFIDVFALQNSFIIQRYRRV
jgi:hypothetical protein